MMITHCAIYPPLGCARLGNSEDPEGYFFAPEVPGSSSSDINEYKDGPGSVKRQAVRFRVYAFDGDQAVRELTLDDPAIESIEWTVHVANAKASWYEYNNAMDVLKIYDPAEYTNLDITQLPTPIAAKRRNRNIIGEDRQKLNIHPDPADISGRSQKSGPLSGRISTSDQDYADVTLAELRTDDVGRLIFLGGSGRSESLTRFNPIQNFSNNNGWFDDICDGWVKATVRFTDGTEFQADPAWVFTAPPDYAPDIAPLITMYDVIRGVSIKQGWIEEPLEPSFTDDIYPILHRLGQMQWVSHAASLLYGWGSETNLLDPELIADLANKDSQSGKREQIFNLLRSPAYEPGSDPIPAGDAIGPVDTPLPQPQRPMMLGDGIDFPGSPMQWFAIPKMKYEQLRQWSEGNFNPDWEPNANEHKPTTIEKIESANEQIDALTQAALQPIYGGAFHPGVEITWPMRHAQMYEAHRKEEQGDTVKRSDLFRLAVSDTNPIYTDYGPMLTPEIAFHEDPRVQHLPKIVGPQSPGGLTRWMGVPWQCDAASCQTLYLPQDFPVPVWWPANLPVHVLPQNYYQYLLNPDIPTEQRVAFFNFREAWTRGVGEVGYHAEGGYTNAITHMINDWDHMGFVLEQSGPQDLSANGIVPESIFVETGRDPLSG
ncbi:MAG: LodA/GoxA family CTQ-dependent oxidase [Ardenticatenaceae bacterium]